MRSRTLTAALGVALVVLVLIGAYVVRRGYPAELRARLGEGGPSAQVVDLHSIDQLEAAFNDDAGTARLLVLFSPT
jgi:ABC-type lipoprotein release transport system permease subunit